MDLTTLLHAPWDHIAAIIAFIAGILHVGAKLSTLIGQILALEQQGEEAFNAFQNTFIGRAAWSYAELHAPGGATGIQKAQLALTYAKQLATQLKADLDAPAQAAVEATFHVESAAAKPDPSSSSAKPSA